MITLPKATISQVSRTLLGDVESRFQQLCEALSDCDFDEAELRKIIVPSSEQLSGFFKAGKPSARKMRDPAAPKRAQTAYMLWLQDNRDSIKDTLETELGGELQGREKVTAVAKRAGSMWKELSEDEKAPFVEKAAEASAAYKAAKAEYSPSAPVYSSSKVDFNTLPQDEAPAGWSGPFAGKCLWKFTTVGKKLGVGRFNTFEEAIAAAEKLSSEGVEVGGITRDKSGYSIRRTNDLFSNEGSSNDVSWVYGEATVCAPKKAKVEKPKTLKVEKPKAEKKEKKAEKKEKKVEKKEKKVEKPKSLKVEPKKSTKSKEKKPKKTKAKKEVTVIINAPPIIDVEVETFGPPEEKKPEEVVVEEVEVEVEEEAFGAETDDEEDPTAENDEDDDDAEEVEAEAEEVIGPDGVTYWKTEDGEVYNEDSDLVGKMVDGEVVLN